MIISKKEMQLYQKNTVIFLLITEKPNLSDIEKLIKKVKQTVSDKAGVNLELEIKIIGE